MISYKYHNDNIIHSHSSKILLNMSITYISMFHNLPYMMYFRPLVKILLKVMDLNMAYKIHKTSKYTRNSDFSKIARNPGSVHISRSSAPYAPFFPLLTLLLYNYRLQQLQPPLPALHTLIPIPQPFGRATRIRRAECLENPPRRIHR